ncbi:hypothetical protein PGT21_012946 [Puccinia graminis f. sp. tritici]|uniref:Uncharacterized protein n=1 Tax=Puccinia graminis f. sp. tritici TaxID=56615 RepID=A0A5B0NC51_PUCGR|nr:hypothetical protein PGT21_012946 [Puccinia graminis f. sp. tritici]
MDGMGGSFIFTKQHKAQHSATPQSPVGAAAEPMVCPRIGLSIPAGIAAQRLPIPAGWAHHQHPRQLRRKHSWIARSVILPAGPDLATLNPSLARLKKQILAPPFAQSSLFLDLTETAIGQAGCHFNTHSLRIWTLDAINLWSATIIGQVCLSLRGFRTDFSELLGQFMPAGATALATSLVPAPHYSMYQPHLHHLKS